MTILTIDDKEYDTDNLNEDQNKIVSILNVGINTTAVLNHMLQCVQAVQNIKVNELKASLEDYDADQVVFDL
jgi:hypothetical protein|tara:strand:- start:622 stop:837 length:216 start_codon:yes stop_codon:yes gene_type:complete